MRLCRRDGLTLRKRGGLSQEALAGLLILLLPPERLRSWRKRLPQRDRRRLLGWLALGMGLLGNGVFFLLSRLEKVPFPLISREGGQTWYTWGVQETYSYRWFLYDRHLTACAVLLWLLALAGLLVLLLPPERLQIWRKRLPQREK